MSSHVHQTLIRNMIESPEWNLLRPNFPNNRDLLPQSLETQQILAIGDAVSELSAESYKKAADYEFGTLTPFTGYAEQKSSYRLRTRLGNMVVHVLPFPTEKATIPTSPFLTHIHSTPTQELFEYSDARTYCTFPWSGETSIRFQEDAGTAFFAFGAATLSRKRAERTIRDSGIHLTGNDVKQSRIEMSHIRHHLHKPGYFLPLLIDIPVVARKKSI